MEHITRQRCLDLSHSCLATEGHILVIKNLSIDAGTLVEHLPIKTVPGCSICSFVAQDGRTVQLHRDEEHDGSGTTIPQVKAQAWTSMGAPWRVEQISIATVVKEGEAIKLAPKTLDAIETMTRLQGDQHPDDLLLLS
ncbi:hypothetical protein A4X13_0g7922 [Tilletia indica]|uniref:Uncharacterized protein n=1 Tax=Tilletia indica TaxID=43049 RepID=A0A177T3T6_9BASI|nr:hypothetical protein A4X13_0g7922 [Tilletia indica]